MSKEIPQVWPPEGAPQLELYTANRAYQRAVDLMDEAATAYLGINRSDGRCLDVLEELGPITAGELAAATGLSPGRSRRSSTGSRARASSAASPTPTTAGGSESS